MKLYHLAPQVAVLQYSGGCAWPPAGRRSRDDDMLTKMYAAALGVTPNKKKKKSRPDVVAHYAT